MTAVAGSARERGRASQAPSPSGIADALTGSDPWAWLASFGVAAVLHLGAWTVAQRLPVTRDTPAPVSEIELVAPPAPPDPPPAPPPADTVDTAKAAPPAPVARAAAAPRLTPPPAAPPPAARAGNVLTARDGTAGDAIDFVTDPNGQAYGSGVVARGGTADHGAPRAAPTPTPTPEKPAAPAAPRADAVAPPESLSRPARLSEPNPCAGYYPSAADADSGQVTVSLVVRPSGDLASLAVVSESPAGEGFGAAARACLAKKRLAPALDHGGQAVTAALTVRVRFSR